MGLFSKEEPKGYTVKDKPMACVYCKNELFFMRSALLNTSGAEFLGMAWANRGAKCFVCSECDYIHWFID
ncbi:MAG: DNA-binding protein [Bacteroidetes bacterium]|nr:DNA-binding protein [Bacteroidota bacterium]